MNGAEAITRTLVDSGVDVGFVNPGTSEMHLVAAADRVPQMRWILGLFEGVLSGAADGYARIADRPAATLLHLGPGQANALANLHNARRARSPLVNIVGDHATYHDDDFLLASDIETASRSVSAWIRRATDAATVGADTAAAVSAAHGPPGRIATLIVPADVAWNEGATSAASELPAGRPTVDDASVEHIASLLAAPEPVVFLIGGSTTRAPGLAAAGSLTAASGASVILEAFPARVARGGATAHFPRLGYRVEDAVRQFASARHVVLVEADAPAIAFAYPNHPSRILPSDCEVHVLATPAHDGTDALLRLLDRLPTVDAGATASAGERPEPPTGALTPQAVGMSVGVLLEEGTIVVDEALTSGPWIAGATRHGPAHDWLTLTGGSIGMGLPLSVGAAVAAPTAAWSPSRPTAVRSTRSRRCGPWHASNST